MLELEIAALIIMIGLSGFFSSAETAFFSLNMVRVRMLVKKRVKNAKTVRRLKERPQKLLITILIGNNLVNIGSAALATDLATKAFGSVGIGIATGAITLLILVFGEITPKSYATVHAEGISLRFSKVILALSYILWPLVIVFEKMILRMTGTRKRPLITAEEIKTIVEMGAEEKVIEEKEKQLIKGVLQFKNITAEEVMTPRTEMFTLEAGLQVKDVIDSVIKCPFSRIPLHRGTKDKIVGILYVRDLIKILKKRKAKTKLKSIAKKPIFVSHDISVSDLFKEFQKRHVHVAIAADEYGGTAGLVTLEDLIEEVVGEIIDETDVSKRLIKRIDKKTILVHGRTEIALVNDFFNTTLPETKKHVTISGLLMSKTKTLPRKGRVVKIGKLTMEVAEIREKKITKIRISKAR
jgi:CBS domain containing-hemolysin-like protein